MGSKRIRLLARCISAKFELKHECIDAANEYSVKQLEIIEPLVVSTVNPHFLYSYSFALNVASRIYEYKGDNELAFKYRDQEICLDRKDIVVLMNRVINIKMRKQNSDLKAWFESLTKGIELAEKTGKIEKSQHLKEELIEFVGIVGIEVADYWQEKTD